jgi:hypothetical protein
MVTSGTVGAAIFALVAAVVLIAPNPFATKSLPSVEPVQLRYYAPFWRPDPAAREVLFHKNLPLVDYGGPTRGNVTVPWCANLKENLATMTPVSMTSLRDHDGSGTADGRELKVAELDNAFVGYEGIVFNSTTMMYAPWYVVRDLKELELISTTDETDEHGQEYLAVQALNLNVFRFASVVEQSKVGRFWQKKIPRELYNEVDQIKAQMAKKGQKCSLSDRTAAVATFDKLAVFTKINMSVNDWTW